MEAPPIPKRHAVVQRIAEQLVPEVVEALVNELEGKQDPALHELVQGLVQIRDLAIHDAREDLGRERSTQDRTGKGDRAGLGTQSAGMSKDRVLDRVRHLCRVDRPAVPGRLRTGL